MSRSPLAPLVSYGMCPDNVSKNPFVWEVGVKWDTDDEDEELLYDWFTHKDTFNDCIEIVSKKQRTGGYTFMEDEARKLIGTRVRAKTSFNFNALQKGAEGTVTDVRQYVHINGTVTWQVVITWDTTTE